MVCMGVRLMSTVSKEEGRVRGGMWQGLLLCG